MPRRATPNSRNTPHLSPPATRLATGVDALVDADPAHAPAASASSRSLSSLRMPSDMGPSTLGADPVPVDAAHWGAPMSRKPTIVLGIVVMLTVAALRPILNARGKAVCLVRCTGRAHVGRRSWLGCRCLCSLRSTLSKGNAVPCRGSDRGTRRGRSDRATTSLYGAYSKKTPSAWAEGIAALAAVALLVLFQARLSMDRAPGSGRSVPIAG